MDEILSVYDLLLTPIYVLVIFMLAYYYQKSKQLTHPEYKYFTSGLMVKIAGAIALGVVYNFYYETGDTNSYFQSGRAFSNLLGVNNENFIEGWLGNPGTKAYLFFNEETGFPGYMNRDAHTFFVVRLEIPIVMAGCKTYFPSAVLTATICYSGIWKLYKVFHSIFPHLAKQLAFAILFVPSVVFWGSGIMKDSFTISGVGWFTYSFYNFFIQKKYSPLYLIQLLVAGFIIVSIKPYIFFAILPGTFIWLSNEKSSKVENKVLKLIFGPIMLVVGGIAGFFILYGMSDYLGMYKIDSVLDRAVIVQKDMKADYYKGNSFDIGEFDASVGGATGKAPVAIFAGLFRPSIIDVKNPMMILSALENTFFLLLTIYLLFKLRIKGFLGAVRSNPIVLFSMLFSLFFAFSVGLSVSNFGSLVRLRIPEIPFFMASLFIIQDIYKRKKHSLKYNEPLVKN